MNTETMVSDIAAAALRKHWRLMTAESCTGGLAAAALTALPGASRWFDGGVIAYHNTLKQHLLGVSAQTLAAHGAVSEQTALAMCGGLRQLKADAGIAVTGVAGPGGSDSKPAGAVWVGVFTPARCDAVMQNFSGGREEVRAQAVRFALSTLLAACRQP